MSDSSETNSSILSGMRFSKAGQGERRQESQARFFQAYRPLLFSFFKRKGIGDNDADDLASDLITALLQRMDTFEYDPTQGFRKYLRTAASNAVKGFWEKQAKRLTSHGVDLQKLVAEKDLRERIEKQFDLEILQEAERLAHDQVSYRDWKIYVELTRTPSKPEELGKTLGIELQTVYVTKARVINRIRTEVQKLEHRGPES